MVTIDQNGVRRDVVFIADRFQRGADAGFPCAADIQLDGPIRDGNRLRVYDVRDREPDQRSQDPRDCSREYDVD